MKNSLNGSYKGKGGLKLKGSNRMRNTLGTKDIGPVSAKKGKKIYLGSSNRGTSNLSGSTK